MRKFCLLLFVLSVGLFFMISPTQAAPGDVRSTINTPVESPPRPGDPGAPIPLPGLGISVAKDCEETFFYTHVNDTNLYKMDKDGNAIGVPIPIVDDNNEPLVLDALSWDEGRKMLWAGTDWVPGDEQHDIFLLDPVSGQATWQFNIACSTCITPGIVDGVAYDFTDDTLWVSSDLEPFIWHHQASGALIGAPLNPKNPDDGGDLFISGLEVVNSGLHVAVNPPAALVKNKRIYKVSKGGTVLGIVFEDTPTSFRIEDLECDAVSFAPDEVVWFRDAQLNEIIAVEVAPGTCKQCVPDERPPCLELFCGQSTVNWIELFESLKSEDIPVESCNAWFNFDLYVDGELAIKDWVMYAQAFGTQINLALLKAHNHNDEISICFCVTFDKDGYHLTVTNVDFGEDPPPPTLP